MARSQAIAEATETTETKTKAAKGTSIPAQSKDLVLRIFDELLGADADGEISESTSEWLTNLRGEILESSVRGLTPEVQLEKAQEARNAIYLRAGVVDGVFAFASDEDAELNESLTTKIKNLKAKIAKAKAGEDSDESDEATTEQGEETTD